MGVANLHPRVLEGISHAPREESEVLSFPFHFFVLILGRLFRHLACYSDLDVSPL